VRHAFTLAVVLWALAAGCTGSDPAPAVADAKVGGSAPDTPGPLPASRGEGVSGNATATAIPDAGTPDATKSPPPAPISSAVAVVAGQEVPLARQGVTTIDPAATFRVEVATHLADGRLALLDGADAMVVSTGTTELGASFTRYHLVPAELLRPGSRYHLRLEGAATREAHDAAGRAYGPVVHELGTSGERPAAPAKKRGKRRP
jgi:hypothetical protein